jgi:hypothetical protein
MLLESQIVVQSSLPMRSPLLSSHLYLKVTFFLSCHGKVHMNWTSFKRSPVLKNHFCSVPKVTSYYRFDCIFFNRKQLTEIWVTWLVSYKPQELLALYSRVLVRSVSFIVVVICVVYFCFVCLRSVSCKPNVARFSGLSILWFSLWFSLTFIYIIIERNVIFTGIQQDSRDSNPLLESIIKAFR